MCSAKFKPHGYTFYNVFFYFTGCYKSKRKYFSIFKNYLKRNTLKDFILESRFNLSNFSASESA